MKSEKASKFRRFVLGTFISIGTCMVTGAISPVLAQDALDMIIVQGGEEGDVDPDYAAQNETFVKNKVMGGQDLLTTPTTVNIIDAERFNLDTVNFTEDTLELLTRVPGLSGSRNLRVDCGWCDYTVNLQNGMATNPLGSGNYNFDGANNFDIQRIEIIKGPASALYPSHAFGGVIDVITKDAPDIPEFKVFGDVGSWGRRRGGFSLGGTQNGLGIAINGFGSKMDGWRTGRRENKHGGGVRFNYELSSDTTVQVGGGYTHDFSESVGDLNQAQWDEDWGQVPLSRGEPDISVSHSDLKTADASIEHKFSDSFKMKLAYGFVYKESEGKYSDGVDERHDIKPRFTKDFTFWKSQLITGVDFSHDENERLGDSGTTVTAKIISPYAQYAFSPFTSMSLLEPLKFTLGGRYETFDYEYTKKAGGGGDNEVQNLTPHLGATYKLNDNNSVWISYSEGISVPGASRMFPTSGRTIYADNPDLEPEEAINWEFGLRGNVLDGIFAYDVAWHDLQISNFMMLEEISTDVFQYQNIGGVSIRGLEAQIAVWPVKWAGVEMAYTYGIHRFTDYVTGGVDYSGNYMRRSVPHRLNTRFIVKPVEGAKVELEWDYNSAAHTNYSNTETYKRPDLFHLSASYKWRDMITVWGQVRNLTNEKYANRVSAEEDGSDREYDVGLPRSWAFGLSGKVNF
jgi:iron complex outermembrane recepter protein